MNSSENCHILSNRELGMNEENRWFLNKYFSTSAGKFVIPSKWNCEAGIGDPLNGFKRTIVIIRDDIDINLTIEIENHIFIGLLIHRTIYIPEKYQIDSILPNTKYNSNLNF